MIALLVMIIGVIKKSKYGAIGGWLFEVYLILRVVLIVILKLPGPDVFSVLFILILPLS